MSCADPLLTCSSLLCRTCPTTMFQVLILSVSHTLPGSTSLPHSPHCSPLRSGAGGVGGYGWSVYSSFSLLLLSSHIFPLLQHEFSTGASWNQLCPARGIPWPFLTEVTPAVPTAVNTWVLSPNTQTPKMHLSVSSRRTLASPSHCSTFFLYLSMGESGQTVVSSAWDRSLGERLQLNLINGEKPPHR